jgi:L-glutamine-phosphate cytidylyltransferase
MQAIIVAAGRSSRLYPLTSETPKCLLEIAGTSLIQRAVQQLKDLGVSDIQVVVGFQHQKIRQALKDQVHYVLNPFYAQTNNMGSLWLALPYIAQDFLYLHADVIFHTELLAKLVRSTYPQADIELLVDFESINEEAMKVRLENGAFIESSKEIPLHLAAGEWLGLTRFTLAARVALQQSIETILGEDGFQEYDTAAFNRLAREGVSFAITSTDGLPWCEIDTLEDLTYAKDLFEPDQG